MEKYLVAALGRNQTQPQSNNQMAIIMTARYLMAQFLHARPGRRQRMYLFYNLMGFIIVALFLTEASHLVAHGIRAML